MNLIFENSVSWLLSDSIKLKLELDHYYFTLQDNISISVFKRIHIELEIDIQTV